MDHGWRSSEDSVMDAQIAKGGCAGRLQSLTSSRAMGANTERDGRSEKGTRSMQSLDLTEPRTLVDSMS
jgi:hypothetical protein